jgi:general secretion pathway protein F
MPQYRYQALNAAGKTQSGEIAADSTQLALAELERQGLRVISINMVPEAPAAHLVDERVDARPQAFAAWALLAEPMRKALARAPKVLPALIAFSQELPQGRSRRQLEQVIGVLERGKLDEALASVEAMPDYWVPFLRLATKSNDAVPLLREFFRETQQSDQFRRESWLVLAYPLWIAALGTGVLVVLSRVVLPTYRAIFESFAISMPTMTSLVFLIAEGVATGWLFLVLGGVVLIGLGAWWLAGRLPQDLRDRWSDRLAFRTWRAMPRARLSARIADLLDVGLGIADAVQVAGKALGNSRVGRAAAKLAADLRGQQREPQPAWDLSLSASLLHAVRADLPAPARTDLLRALNVNFVDQAGRNRSWKRWFAGPVAICLVGLMILFTVLALFLPLIKLVESLT